MRFKGVWLHDWPIIQPTAQAPPTTGSAQAVYRIENMDCPTEEALIRSKLAGLAGWLVLNST
jgi:Cd2+/Zn2+-exporting ATPase